MHNYSNYYDYVNKINNNIQDKNNQDNFNPYKGFVMGNLFDNLYVPYKSFKPFELNPNNEKEYTLLLVQSYLFATHELNLYLDTNPNDSSAIKLRSKYYKMYLDAKTKYENMYGPIDMDSDNLEVVPWSWDSMKWPWEGNK